MFQVEGLNVKGPVKSATVLHPKQKGKKQVTYNLCIRRNKTTKRSDEKKSLSDNTGIGKTPFYNIYISESGQR